MSASNQSANNVGRCAIFDENKPFTKMTNTKTSKAHMPHHLQHNLDSLYSQYQKNLKGLKTKQKKVLKGGNKFKFFNWAFL